MVLNVAPPVAPQCPVSQLGGRLCHSVVVESGTSGVKELLLHQLGVQQTAHVALRGRDLVRQRTAIIFDYCWTPASILPQYCLITMYNCHNPPVIAMVNAIEIGNVRFV